MNPRTPVCGRTGRAVASLVAAAAAAVAGCGTTEPARRPDAALPAAWSATSSATSSSANPAGTGPDAPVAASKVSWQNFFTDPRLQALIALSLANNRDLRIAASKVEQERARYKMARADQLPSVTGQASLSRSSTPSDLSTGASAQRFDLQGLFSYEIDFWGRVAAMSASARASFLATEEARREVYLSLISDVAGAYFAVLEAEELIALAQSSLSLREQSLNIITRAGEVGGSDDDERQLAFIGLQSARAGMAQMTHQRNLAVNRLDALVGVSGVGALGGKGGRGADDLPPGRPLVDQQPGAALEAGLPSEVLLHRPDVMAAEQRLKAANADVDAARAAYMPKISLTAALGLASPGLAGLFSGGAWSYQPLISSPLFDGGRTEAGADLARARQVAAIADYEKTLQQAFRNVADQLSARTSVRAQLDASVASERLQGRRLAMASGRFEIGVTSYRDVLESQRALLSTIQNTVQLRRAEQDAAAALYKALGGGADTEFVAVGDPNANANANANAKPDSDATVTAKATADKSIRNR